MKIYKKGIVSETIKEIEEFLGKEKHRYLKIVMIADSSSRLEMIKIGLSYFQKDDNNPWKKPDRWERYNRPMGIPMPKSEIFSVEDTKLDGKNVKVYRSIAVYDETYFIEDRDDIETSWEDKFWIDSKGNMLREEILMRKPRSNKLLSERVWLFEINPKDLKIEAPIK